VVVSSDSSESAPAPVRGEVGLENQHPARQLADHAQEGDRVFEVYSNPQQKVTSKLP